MERNQQLKDLQVLIEDEILLLKYEPEFQHLALALEIRKKWNADRNIRNFNRWLTHEFESLVPSFVALNDEVGDEAVTETLILRFLTLTTVILAVSGFLEFDLKPQLTFQDDQTPDLNQVVSQGVAFFISSELPMFAKKLQKIKIPEFLQSWLLEFQIKTQSLVKVGHFHDLEMVVDQIYLVYEFVTDFLDYLDQTEFEIDDAEILELNQILNYILYIHGILYNLLLVIEKMFDLEEERKQIQLMLNKELLEEHDSRLEMMKLLANEPWN